MELEAIDWTQLRASNYTEISLVFVYQQLQPKKTVEIIKIWMEISALYTYVQRCTALLISTIKEQKEVLKKDIRFKEFQSGHFIEIYK
jgi:hypothetical protein